MVLLEAWVRRRWETGKMLISVRENGENGDF
jgi:hypothetical protein